ncbi:unnamed protein product [Hymenolepis diminuta]|uniref:Protein kinase domain-containing protein n=1 Tax=Hymenolepis diminuta TaxID=6216 RepID=A0A0R3SKK4_HYMDI|nr:unnamed protein product [Hymenolepis diminuta]
MKEQEEKGQIQTFLNRPSGRQLFRIRGSDAFSLHLGVLGDPEGHIMLLHPTGSPRPAIWNIMMPNTLPERYRADFYFEVANMIQGFMACVFVATRRHGMEMPPEIGIMVEPGGYIELNNPPISGFQPRWDVVVNSETSRPCHCMFYLDVGSMTQAFMACVYVATTRLGLPMPFEVIQFDPEFYDLLPTLTPTNSTHYVIAIIEATRNEACAFSFYF